MKNINIRIEYQDIFLDKITGLYLNRSYLDKAGIITMSHKAFFENKMNEHVIAYATDGKKNFNMEWDKEICYNGNRKTGITIYPFAKYVEVKIKNTNTVYVVNGYFETEKLEKRMLAEGVYFLRENQIEEHSKALVEQIRVEEAAQNDENHPLNEKKKNLKRIIEAVQNRK